jgi:hypothetical protein
LEIIPFLLMVKSSMYFFSPRKKSSYEYKIFIIKKSCCGFI